MPRDPATGESDGHFLTDYTPCLDPNGLQGARIGIVRQYFGINEHADRIVEPLIDVMRDKGAVLVDPANFANFEAFPGEQRTVLQYEFKADLNRYLSSRPDVPVHSLEELIAFNSAHGGGDAISSRSCLFRHRHEARSPIKPTSMPWLWISGSRDRKASTKSWIAWSWMHSSPQLAVLPGPSTSSTAVAVHRELDAGGPGRLSAHHRPSRVRLRRIARGRDLHGASLERANAHQNRLRLRTSDQGPASAPKFLPTLRFA